MVFEYSVAFIIPFIYIFCRYICRSKPTPILFSGVKFLQSASKQESWLLKIVEFLALLFLTIALASPIKENHIELKSNQGYEISLIMDISGSMRENGKYNIVRDIMIDFLQKRASDKIALSIFADFAYVAVPLTYDKNSIKKLLEKVEIGIAGVSKTALYEALFLSSNIFRESKSKNKIAILLTDGRDNANTIPLKKAIDRANKYGLKVYTIGIGSKHDYDGYILEQIALKCGGEFFQANSIDRLKQIYNKIDELEKSKIIQDRYIDKTYYYYYPLSIFLLFATILFYMRNRR
jgi:Ca-activated chloride channel family protein